uniref:Uncharacterized protein n=1 Tax=Salarias fasciatus TaxID=181472 RepID=A0A672IYD1_SALFA
MVPGAVVDLRLGGLNLDGPGAHVQQQVQPSVQQLHREEVHLVVLEAFGVPSVLRLPVGEEDEPVGLGGAEIEGDGAHALGVPLGQSQEGVRGLEVDGIQGGDVFALEDHVALKLHLGVDDASEAGQLQTDVVVFVHHLGKSITGRGFITGACVSVQSGTAEHKTSPK